MSNIKVMNKTFQPINSPIKRAEGFILQHGMLENFFQLIMYYTKDII